jgi:hypothetical protein
MSKRAAEQRQPLADAEESPTGRLRTLVELLRVEPDPAIADGDTQLILGVERQLDADADRRAHA